MIIPMHGRRMNWIFSQLRLGVWGFIIALILSLALAEYATAAKPETMIPDALIEPGAGPDRRMIVVEKSSQRLFVYEFKMGRYYLLATYNCSTGENKGDKKVEGDKKTPEGVYMFVKKSLEHELAPIYGVLAYPMDYPNFWDRYEGKNGMGIWMHGTNKSLAPRDSNGCIALENISLVDLEPLISLYDTPIIVYDVIRYKPVEAVNREAARVRAFIESWRKAWENKDFETYKSKYALDFHGDDGRDYTAWMDHKKRLNEIYKRIRVDLERLRIYRHRPDILLVIFDQYYQGDSFSSDGEKRLYIRENQDGFKIAAEIWNSFPPKVPARFLSAEVKERILGEGKEPAAPVVVAAAPKKTPAVKPAAAPATVAARNAKQNIDELIDEETQNVEKVVADWLRDWGAMDVDGYVAHYHPDFKFNDMDLESFRDYKKKLAKKYNKISIKVENLKVRVDGGKAFVTFLQKYQSDQYRDYGLKTLLLKKEKDNWLICQESWQDMSGGGKP